MDCSDLPAESSSDMYVIQPLNSVNVTVFCEMETDGGGWTVSMNSVNITVFCEMETDCGGWTVSMNSVNMTVFCEMETDGGGWTVSMTIWLNH